MKNTIPNQALETESTTVCDPFQLGREIGLLVQERWRAVNNDHRCFAEIAVEVLTALSPAGRLSAADVVRSVFAEPVLPDQEDPDAAFGDMPLTLFRGREFYVSVLFWLDLDTSIHQHSFAGAFQVLTGSSVHSKYRFDESRYLDEHVRLGELSVIDVELLEPGDVRPILPGDGATHSLLHIERPTVTFIVREYVRPSHLPQYAYVRPGVAYNPFFSDHTMKRRMQMLGVLHKLDAPELGEMIHAIARERAPSAILTVALWAGGRRADHAEQLVQAVGEHDPQYAAALRAVLDEIARGGRIQAAWQKVHGTDERVLLALMSEFDDREAILRQMARLRPSTDASELLTRAIAGIVRQTHGLDISADGLDVLAARVAQATTVNGLENFPAGDAGALKYITHDSRLFAPLFS